MNERAGRRRDGVGTLGTVPISFNPDPVQLTQLIVDSAVDYAIVTLAPDGTITSWNEGAERIMGWTADEIVGRPAATFFVPEDVRAGRPEHEMQLAEELGVANDERWHLAKSGARFWASGRMMPLVARPDTEGLTPEANLTDVPGARQIGYLKILRDRTEQRNELMRQTALLDLGDRLRDMTDRREMAALSCELIGQTLGATRAGHGTLDPAGSVIDIQADWTSPGSQSLVGQLRYEDFGTFAEELRRGEIVVMEDCRTHPAVPDPAPLEAFGVRALLNVPLMKRGHLKAVMIVNDDKPRSWTEAELRFVRGVADRTHTAIERVRLEVERDLVSRELAHRMKNVLTIAQVIAVQSLRHVASLEEGRQAVAERLTALGRAQDMLTDIGKEGAGIRSVVTQALTPHLPEDANVGISGPDILLSGPQVLGLTLALHELATNAAKYGALSVPSGGVTINWTVSTSQAFHFTWEERGGPTVVEPTRKGFGSQILGRVTGGYFDGTSRVIFEPDGLQFVLNGIVGS